MRKRFNVNGICIPELHYMVHIDARLKSIKELIDLGEYFTINRARQFGKTTTLVCLEKFLSDDYFVLFISFEGADRDSFASEASFCTYFIKLIYNFLKFSKDDPKTQTFMTECKEIIQECNKKFGFLELSDFISSLCHRSEKPVVLLIDEVDQAGNYERFLTFLGMLRNKYLSRIKVPTFQSVILAGVYDIKNLKLKIRKSDEHLYNSPWNIAADFTVDMSFSQKDIAGMLQDYEQSHHTGMDIPEISSVIYDYTSGYPYLVSRICKLIDETISQSPVFSEKNPWIREGIFAAVDLLLKKPNMLLDDMMKQLADYPELDKIIQNILFEGASYPFNIYEHIMNLGVMFGFLKDSHGVASVSNRIFEMHLYQYYLSRELTKKDSWREQNFSVNQFTGTGHLDMDFVMARFLEYYTDLYNEADEKFLEKHGRKLFLLYLKPIINGTGNFYVEAQTRDQTRTDLVVDYLGEQFVVELKLWRGDRYNEDGRKQLADYLDFYHLKKGYLLIFNFNKNKRPGMRMVSTGDKVILETTV